MKKKVEQRIAEGPEHNSINKSSESLRNAPDDDSTLENINHKLSLIHS